MATCTGLIYVKFAPKGGGGGIQQKCGFTAEPTLPYCTIHLKQHGWTRCRACHAWRPPTTGPSGCPACGHTEPPQNPVLSIDDFANRNKG